MDDSTQVTSLAKSSIRIFITRVLIFGLSLISGVIIARSLGPEGKGAYALLLFIPLFLLRFTNFGVGPALIFFSKRGKYSLETLTTNAVIFSFVLGTVIIIVGLLFFDPLYERFFAEHIKDPLMLKALLFLIPFQLTIFYLMHNLLAKNDIPRYNIVEIATPIAHITVLIIFISLLRTQLWGALAAFIASVVIPFCIIVIMARRSIISSFTFSFQAFTDSIKYGLKNHITTLSDFVNLRFDIFLMGIFLSTTSIGIYTVAVGLAELLWYIPNSISTVLFPEISSVKDERANYITAKILRISFFIVICTSLVLLLCAKPLIALLYGSNFLGAVQPFLFLVPGIVTLSLTKILISDLSGRGRPGIVAVVSLFTAAIHILLNVILIPRMGIVGASIASTCSYVFSGIIMLTLFMRFSHNSLRESLLVTRQDLREVRQVVHHYLSR